MSESERGYGGQAGIDRMKRRMAEGKVDLDHANLPDGGPRAVWVEPVGPNRLMTHYVGDECEPDGHVTEMHGG